jgi:hypothetical protein
MADVVDVNAILAENDSKIKEVTEIKPLTEEDVLPQVEEDEEEEGEVQYEPIVQSIEVKNRWLEAKKEYLSNQDAKVVELSRKYKIDPIKLQQRIKEEKWESQRMQLFARADEKARSLMESSMAEVKSRHILIGQMLQKLGQKSIRRVKPLLDTKQSLNYIVEGVRIEREAFGLDKQSPKIVNIIAQQQQVLTKYRKNGQSTTVTSTDGTTTQQS